MIINESTIICERCGTVGKPIIKNSPIRMGIKILAWVSFLFIFIGVITTTLNIFIIGVILVFCAIVGDACNKPKNRCNHCNASELVPYNSPHGIKLRTIWNKSK